jgi:hypothetical protein
MTTKPRLCASVGCFNIVVGVDTYDEEVLCSKCRSLSSLNELIPEDIEVEA